jgi:hypothetical protein
VKSNKKESVMAYSFEQLHKMRVADLRQIAKDLEFEELKGHTTMHKEPLVLALCHALGIEDHVHHKVVGVDKTKIKQQIREFKKERDAALEAKDSKKLKLARAKISRLKKKLRQATV